MLEKAIEIEGLLRIIRDGNPLPETYKLMIAKVQALASKAVALSAEAAATAMEEEPSMAEKPGADFIMAAPEAATEPPKVDFINLEEQKDQTPIIQSEAIGEGMHPSTDHTEIDLDLEEEDDIILSFDDITEPTQTSEDIITTDTMEGTTEKESEKKSSREEQDTDEYEKKKTTSTQETSQPAVHKDKTLQKRQVRLKAAFSLNDRFLYARELFNGNMKMFDSTLDFLEGIDDFSIIEDYFYNELEWNPEDYNVVSFMERLRGVF